MLLKHFNIKSHLISDIISGGCNFDYTYIKARRAKKNIHMKMFTEFGEALCGTF